MISIVVNLDKAFEAMFPDSGIAKKFTLGRAKPF